MRGLMLHCGGTPVSRTEIGLVDLPEATRTFHPMAHSDLLDEVEYAVGRIPGIEIYAEEHGLNHGGSQYFGLLHLRRESPFGDIYETIMGLRNSHNKSLSAGVVIGKNVFVCDNLAFCGDIRVGRKHTRKISTELPGLIREAAMRLLHIAERDDSRTESYMGKIISEETAAHSLLKMYETGGVPAQSLGNIWKEFMEPKHVEHLNENGDRTLWTLSQAITEIHRPTPMNLLTEYTKRTIQQTRILDAVAGVDYEVLEV